MIGSGVLALGGNPDNRIFRHRSRQAGLEIPSSNSAIRRDLDQWMSNHELVPQIIGEFEDSALMKVFGQDSIGMFPAPDLIEKEVCRQFGVSVVGRATEVRERYYAISVERRLKHPAVLAIIEAAREELFLR